MLWVVAHLMFLMQFWKFLLTAYIHSNQIMGWGEKAIEIRSVETGHLDGVFMHKRAQRLKFLCERNDKVNPFQLCFSVCILRDHQVPVKPSFSFILMSHIYVKWSITILKWHHLVWFMWTFRIYDSCIQTNIKHLKLSCKLLVTFVARGPSGDLTIIADPPMHLE